MQSMGIRGTGAIRESDHCSPGRAFSAAPGAWGPRTENSKDVASLVPAHEAWGEVVTGPGGQPWSAGRAEACELLPLVAVPEACVRKRRTPAGAGEPPQKDTGKSQGTALLQKRRPVPNAGAWEGPGAAEAWQHSKGLRGLEWPSGFPDCRQAGARWARATVVSPEAARRYSPQQRAKTSYDQRMKAREKNKNKNKN